MQLWEFYIVVFLPVLLLACLNVVINGLIA